ncbi:MAG: hypothetical protein Q4D19_06155 [Lautropia sp.]|nr:hypothetical protein [Lautropia sp.]
MTPPHLNDTAHAPRSSRLSCLLPVSALLLALSACGGTGDEPGSQAKAVNASTPISTAKDDTGTTVASDAPASAIQTKAPGADVCQPVLQHGTALKNGTETSAIPDRGTPGVAAPFQDPNYGSCIARITDNGYNGAYRRSDYSRRQSFNADSSYMLIYALNGFWYLYDAKTLTEIRQLNGPAGDAEPFWHPTDPGKLYYLNRDGIGMQIHLLDVNSNASQLVSDMGAQVQALWPSATAAWTRSEGSPSADGRYWCFLAENSSSWRSVGVFTWDLQENRIVGSMPLSERPDHVSMSPSGNYCVISSDGAMGTRSYRRDFGAPYSAYINQPWLQLMSKSEHSDIAYDRNRVDAYVAVDYAVGDVFSTNLVTGKRTSLFSAYPGRTASALHFSGKAYNNPGWVLVSAYSAYHADNVWNNIRNTHQQQWMHRKMFAVSLEENPTIRPIAHVDSNAVDSGNFFSYWSEPQATVNRDFTRFMFNTNWNSNDGREVETYLAAIPNNAVNR